MVVQTAEGLLRVHDGVVQFRRLNARFWRDLVPIDTLLSLGDEADAGGGDGTGDNGSGGGGVDLGSGSQPGPGETFFVAAFTPDGRDLTQDGWSYPYGGPLAVIEGNTMSFAGTSDSTFAIVRDVPTADYGIRLSTTTDSDFGIAFRDISGVFLNVKPAGPDGPVVEVYPDLNSNDVVTQPLSFNAADGIDLEAYVVGNVLTIAGVDIALQNYPESAARLVLFSGTRNVTALTSLELFTPST